MPILSGVRRLAIWGFGREGRTTLEHIAGELPGCEITLLDDRQLDLDPAVAERVRTITGAETVAAALRAGGFDLVVKSPGISLYRPEIAAARAAGVRFTSAMNLWLERHAGARTIGVTGTKGKSTTSRLLHHLLHAQGLDAGLIGNVGIPALGQAPGRDVTVIELSSYQIADLEHGVDIAVLTSLYPEHAPWHGGVDRYFADKLRLLDLDPRTRAVCNRADARIRALAAGRSGVSWFNGRDGFRTAAGRLLYGEREIALTGSTLRGEHNLSNIAAACAVCDLLDLQRLRERVDLTGFRQLPHRLEEVELSSGILAVNDSISTVPEATIAALGAYPDRDTVLLLGGDDRGQDYRALLGLLPRTRVRHVLLLPRNGARIQREAAADGLATPVTLTQGIDEAVARAFALVHPGGLILLSPAAPSFGEFRDFEQRGETFKRLCLAGDRRSPA